VLRRETQRTADEVQPLVQLRTQSTAVAEAIDLAQDFTQLVRQRQPAQLDPWLKRATKRTLDALRRFAAGLSEDYQAVKAGVTCRGVPGRSRPHEPFENAEAADVWPRAPGSLGPPLPAGAPGAEAQVVGPRAPVQVQAAAQAA